MTYVSCLHTSKLCFCKASQACGQKKVFLSKCVMNVKVELELSLCVNVR
jgi:hypothetical protein